MLDVTWHPCVVPHALRHALECRGSDKVSQMAADLADGELRVLSSWDPIGYKGRRLLHVSASVGTLSQLGSFRRPRDEEIEAVKAAFTQPLHEDNAGTSHPHIRNLWEVER